MWNLILVLICILCLAMVIYVTTRIHRFLFIKHYAKKHRLLAWLISLIPVAAVGMFALINTVTMIIVLMHLLVGFVICDIVAFVVRKALKKNFGYNIQNIAAIILTAIYLGIGWFFAHHVFITEYTFYTEKNIGEDLRIVEIADSHLGITLDGESFAYQMKRVQDTNPDVVVIAGDFVDDDTSKADMIDACHALGNLKTTYGVYFVFGNHDEGYFDYRHFTSSQLRYELSRNGVTILEDESVLIDNRFYIAGRRDRSMIGRVEADALTEELDSSKYIILLDHQPNDYEKEAKTKTDLVLSGHTHGGHIFPAGLIGLSTGANDKVYGSEVQNGTTFVVTSGISGWAIPFKTGTISEFVVIDIKSNSVAVNN